MQSRIATLCSALRSNGILKIVAGKLLAYATSTDGFATAANQTVGAEWTYPGKGYDYNDWMSTQVGTLFDGVMDNNATRDVSAPNLWKGQTPAVTTDGIHPNPTGSGALAPAAKVTMDAAFN